MAPSSAQGVGEFDTGSMVFFKDLNEGATGAAGAPRRDGPERQAVHLCRGPTQEGDRPRHQSPETGTESMGGERGVRAAAGRDGQP